jgi:hypothetical protein
MTATRDPDRLLRAWLDLMPSETPDRAIAAVLQAAEKTRQVRVLPRIGRWRFPMNRLTIVAAAAALIVALVGGAIVFVGSNNSSLPTAAPTPTALSTPTITQDPIVPAAEALWGLWIAEAETIPGLPNQGSRLGMGFNWDGGRDFSVGTSFGGGTDFLTSDTLASTEGQFRLRARDDTHGCASGDVGTYGWQRSANGLFLTVTLVSDQCVLRGTTLARSWVRTLGVANDGRTGMATMADPYPDIQVTLASGKWAMDALPPVDIHTYVDGGPSRDLIIYVNPQGFGEPCSTPGSQPFALDHTAAALKTYLEGLPGMGPVSSKAVTVDGQPATHITTTTGECPDAELALFTQPAFPGSNGGVGEVRAPKGMAVSLWTIVHNGDLVVLWYAGDSIPAAEEQAIIDSLRITDGLPTP